MKLLAIALLVLGIIVFVRRTQADQGMVASKAASIYDFKVKTIDGADKGLKDYQGQVLLIVNTASRCGFTPQYAGLEKLYEKYKARGFVILAFPANDFMGQEPGDNSAIKKFCELRYKTTFPLFAKISVRGRRMAPLYQYLTTASGFNGGITWNFNKFLVDRHGRVMARFGSRTAPLDPGLEDNVLKALTNS
jgi:glutathione peroxidase